MKRFLLVILISTVFLTPVKLTFALDPSLPNNKVGIHIADVDEGNLKKVSELVNSSGGKWGYVTLVIQETDRDPKKWQEVFDRLRKLHLIPIVRIATHPEGQNWRKPKVEDARDWAKFLNSLRWVVRDRYVVLFNEPNQGAEWGGAVDPQDFGRVTTEFAKQLKQTNANFFVMLAGFDSQAPNSLPSLQNQADFLQAVVSSSPELFNFIDGWSSHSYPNPGFVGGPFETGRGTVRNYEWELGYLRQLGVDKNFSVFITETGWPHQVGNFDPTTGQRGFFSPEEGAQRIKTAYEQVWLPDSRVRAVTPFVFSYQSPPFLEFSWKKPQSEEFYPQYSAVKDIPKTTGFPQVNEGGTLFYELPKAILAHSSYQFPIKLKNGGEAIWDKNEGYSLALEGENPFENYFFTDISVVDPNQEGEEELLLKTAGEVGQKSLKIVLLKQKHDGSQEKILEGPTWNLSILPLPQLNLTVKLFPKLRSSGKDFEIQIFDSRQRLVFKRKGVEVKNAKATVDQVKNVYLGGKFRVVILHSHYLPRQAFVTFKKGANEVRFKRMLPVDFNSNGHLDLIDVWTLITNPKLFSLWFP